MEQLHLPLISIIIVNWNGKNHLKHCLPSLLKTNYPREKLQIILVDNNSSDGSISYIENNYPEIQILRLEKNYGFTGGNNRGAKLAQGDFLVFLNNDTEVDVNWLIELVKSALKFPYVGICGSKILFDETRDILQFGGGLLNTIGGGISIFFGKKNTQDSKIKFSGYVCGASFLVRKNIFKKIGGFDEDYFMYSDENDLCLRCWLVNYYVLYVPTSVIYHKGGGSSKQTSSEKKIYSQKNSKPLLQGRILSDNRLYYSTRNSLCNIWKNFELKKIISGTVFSIILCGYHFLSLLKQNKPDKILIMVNGLFSFLKLFPKIWIKRYQIQKYRLLKDQELIDKGIMLPLGQLIAITLKR